jgi:hypothetical protein
MADKVQGSCLCGAVTATVEKMADTAGACHCSSCRKWGGGPLLAVECGEKVSFSGEGNIKRYDSSEWAQRGFCVQCGTHLFYFLKLNGHYIMPAGLFTDRDDFVFDSQVFIEEKPGYYEFSNKTKNMTGAELFAMFAPPES